MIFRSSGCSREQGCGLFSLENPINDQRDNSPIVNEVGINRGVMRVILLSSFRSCIPFFVLLLLIFATLTQVWLTDSGIKVLLMMHYRCLAKLSSLWVFFILYNFLHFCLVFIVDFYFDRFEKNVVINIIEKKTRAIIRMNVH